MSYFLDRLQFFKRQSQTFSDGHGVTRDDNRDWGNSYRSRWQDDKIVRSTHGVNCTGSCSWKIYVKNGLVTWETQQTDYPRTRPDLPNHEPRGCPRGASYSWYLYSANRLKYPLVRGALLRLWREARKTMAPVEAWASIVSDPVEAKAYKSKRGMGGFARVRWEEANEIVAASNLYTTKKFGPDRVVGFSPIPAMSMVSYAAGARYLSLLGGTNLSFYDWYCDLPPASPQVWGGADRRARIGGLVQQPLHHCVGLQRPADAYARCTFSYRSALQRDQDAKGEGPRTLGQPASCYLFVGDTPISEALIAQEMQYHRAITPERSCADAARASVVRGVEALATA